MKVYKVIADYPGSVYKIGEELKVMEDNEGGWWTCEVARRRGDKSLALLLLNPGQYPHLFRLISEEVEFKEKVIGSEKPPRSTDQEWGTHSY